MMFGHQMSILGEHAIQAPEISAFVCIVAALLLILVTRIYSGMVIVEHDTNKQAAGLPVPMIPYWVPKLGHLLTFILNSDKLLAMGR